MASKLSVSQTACAAAFQSGRYHDFWHLLVALGESKRLAALLTLHPAELFWQSVLDALKEIPAVLTDAERVRLADAVRAWELAQRVGEGELTVAQAEELLTGRPALAAVGAALAGAVAELDLSLKLEAVLTGPAEVARVTEAEALCEAETEALLRAVQAEAERVGGEPVELPAGGGARAWAKAKAAVRQDKENGAWLSVRVRPELLERLDALVLLMPPELGPPAGWCRSSVARSVLLTGVEAAERRSKRGKA